MEAVELPMAGVGTMHAKPTPYASRDSWGDNALINYHALLKLPSRGPM